VKLGVDRDWHVGFRDATDGRLIRSVKVAAPPARTKVGGFGDVGRLGEDGRILAINAAKLDTVRFFERAEGKEVFVCATIPHPSLVRFSPDGRYAACDSRDGPWLFRLPDPPAGPRP